MKKGLFFKLTLLFVFVLFLQNGFAQDYTRWGLPEGARARLSKGKLHDIVYSPDGSQFAVASGIGIWLYDAHTGAEIALLTGHTGSVLSVAYSPDGSTLASGGGRVEMARFGCGMLSPVEHQQTLEGTYEWRVLVRGRSLPMDLRLPVGSDDNSIRLWDTTTGETPSGPLRGIHVGCRTVAYSPDGGHTRQWKL